jgi:hypothetical protein
MLPRGDMLAVIERNKDLDGRAINLFRSAEMAIEPVLGDGMRSFPIFIADRCG